jgi:predicted nucleic acid-binding protein
MLADPPATLMVSWITIAIAATAIAHDVPLVTQDRDYVNLPGLEVFVV